MLIGDLVYYDSGTNQLTGLDWSGRTAGILMLPHFGYTLAAPAGDVVLVWPDIINSQGAIVGTVDIGNNDMRDAAWASTGQQLCIVATRPGQSPDGGHLILFIGGPGKRFREVAAVGSAGSIPSIAACNPEGGRIVVVSVQTGHAGYGGASFPMTIATTVVSLPAGNTLYSASYPAVAEPSSATTVVASSDGRYVAESRSGTIKVRDVDGGRVVSSIVGLTAMSFSGDSPATLLAGTTKDRGPVLVNAINGQVLWRGKGVGQWSLGRPGHAEVLIGVVNAQGGLNDLWVVGANGNATMIANNVAPAQVCPCPGANAM
jgi:hypothetical protein